MPCRSSKGGKLSARAKSLVQQVYKSPDDRALRQVLADQLLEDQYVWGELISLQLTNPKQHAERIVKIISRYARDFVGEIANIVARYWELEDPDCSGVLEVLSDAELARIPMPRAAPVLEVLERGRAKRAKPKKAKQPKTRKRSASRDICRGTTHQVASRYTRGMSESKRPRNQRTNDWFDAEQTVVNADFATKLTVSDQRYGESTVLGMGGMGRVALVRDARIGRDVAVKELRLDRELTSEDRARFLREARVQGQLEHPSIVPVYDIDQRADGAIFFTMRRVVGRTLQEILDDLRDDEPFARARFTQRELLTAFATICLAVDYEHTRGVVHRDLKPANLMLGDFGEVYVLDWGVARVLSEPVPAPMTPPRSPNPEISSRTLGTPLYMAPEQMLHPDVGPEADVFALGAILFELLTLQELRTEATLYEPANARTTTRAPERNIAPELEAICVRATETRISARFATPRALQEAIARYLNGDRELEQRRALAGDHSSAAHKALVRANAKDGDYEQERGVAIRELVRALALDPTNEDLVGTLGRVLAAPPRTIPPEVAQDLETSDQDLIHAAMRHSAVAFVVWLAFVPIVYLLGLHDTGWLVFAVVPVCVTAIACYASSRLAVIPIWVQLVVIGLNVSCAVAVKGMFGPLIMVPTLISTIALVVQAHTSRSVRLAGAAFAILGMAVPVVLELAGWISPSYEFADGHMIVLPQMLELHATQTNLVILGGSLLAFVIPGIFIYRLRDALADAQRRLRMQTWHLSRIGDAFTHPATL